MRIKLLDKPLRGKSLLFHSVPLGFMEGLPFFIVSSEGGLLGYYGWSLLRDSLSTRHLGKEINSFLN